MFFVSLLHFVCPIRTSTAVFSFSFFLAGECLPQNLSREESPQRQMSSRLPALIESSGSQRSGVSTSGISAEPGFTIIFRLAGAGDRIHWVATSPSDRIFAVTYRRRFSLSCLFFFFRVPKRKKKVKKKRDNTLHFPAPGSAVLVCRRNVPWAERPLPPLMAIWGSSVSHSRRRSFIYSGFRVLNLKSSDCAQLDRKS